MKYNKFLACDNTITGKKICSIVKVSLSDTTVYSLSESHVSY